MHFNIWSQIELHKVTVCFWFNFKMKREQKIELVMFMNRHVLAVLLTGYGKN